MNTSLSGRGVYLCSLLSISSREYAMSALAATVALSVVMQVAPFCKGERPSRLMP